MKTKAGTDAGVEADNAWVSARHNAQKLKNKKRFARNEVARNSIKAKRKD
jgi:hypothetical protein